MIVAVKPLILRRTVKTTKTLPLVKGTVMGAGAVYLLGR
jgi:hypothetical protein